MGCHASGDFHKGREKRNIVDVYEHCMNAPLPSSFLLRETNIRPSHTYIPPYCASHSQTYNILLHCTAPGAVVTYIDGNTEFMSPSTCWIWLWAVLRAGSSSCAYRGGFHEPLFTIKNIDFYAKLSIFWSFAQNQCGKSSVTRTSIPYKKDPASTEKSMARPPTILLSGRF